MREDTRVRNYLVGLAQRREVENFKAEVRQLIERYRSSVETLDGLQVLHFSVWLTDAGDYLWKELLEIGCNPFVADFNGDTTLHYAVRSANVEYIKYLYSKIGDSVLNVVNHQMCNLMLTCCAETPDERSYGVLHTLEWLYLHGMSIETQDSQGKTPLLWAAQRGSLTICHWLLSRGGHMAHRDNMNRTALHLACSAGNYDIALFLCMKGAVNLVASESHDDKRINTPFKIAWQRGHLWLAVSLAVWRLSYTCLGSCALLTSPYAWAAFSLLCWSFICGECISLNLLNAEYPNANILWFIFTMLMALTMWFWILTAKKDPGAVINSSQLMPAQNGYCSDDAELDLLRYDKKTISRRLPALTRLHNMEVNTKRLALMMARVNKNGHTLARREMKNQCDQIIANLHQLIDRMNELRPDIAAERAQINEKGYRKQILHGSNKRICLTCHTVKGLRDHHCSECGICVQRFDHHCVWVDNCIGLKNQTPFLLFLYCMVASLCLYFVMTFHYLKSNLLSPVDTVYNSSDVITRNLLRLMFTPLFYVTLLNCVCNCLWGIFSGFLLLRTTRSMLTDVTFYESIKRGTHIDRRFGPLTKKADCAWDFADMTCKSAIANTVYFLAQSNGRDATNYEENDRRPLLTDDRRRAEDMIIGRAPLGWRWSLMDRRVSTGNFSVLSNLRPETGMQIFHR